MFNINNTQRVSQAQSLRESTISLAYVEQRRKQARIKAGRGKGRPLGQDGNRVV